MKTKNHSQNKIISLFIIIVIFIIFIGVFLLRQRVSDSVFLIIRNSGSTNFPGYTLTIHYDGHGELVYQNKNRTFPPKTFATAFTLHILNYIGSVNGIPGHSCIKSASFGSVMTIVYKNQTSGDISCISPDDKQSYQQLKQQIEGYVSNIMFR